MINFAQGEMAMFTTYFAYQLTLWGLSYWAAFFLTLVIAFVFGVDRAGRVIRPVQHSVIAVVIVTIGLFVLIDGLVTWIWGADLKFMPAPFGNTVYHVGSVAFARQDIGTIVVTIVSVRAALGASSSSRSSGWRCARPRCGPRRRALVGVRVNWMLALGWGFAAVLGAVAGLMTEPTVFLQPTMMQAVLIYAFAAAVLGGLESPVGAVVGGLALGVFLNLIGQYVGFVTSELRLPVAFAVLLVVLLVKPPGLFGAKQVRRV